MSALYLDVLQVKVDEGVTLLLADDTEDTPADCLRILPGLSPGWRGKGSSKDPRSERPQERPAIIYDADLSGSGMHPLQIHELRTIYWELQATRPGLSTDDFSVLSSLEDSGRHRDWRRKRQKGSLHGTFSFFNYLGAAWLQVKKKGLAVSLPPLHFDVITAKLNYAKEYKAMVEAIGRECHQLLLEWNSPTTMNISQDSYHNAQTLLEQFLFLRHVLGPDRLELYLEVLHRQPHSRLVSEHLWQPSGAADSSLFIRDPLRFGRDWQKALPGSRGMVGGWDAAEILAERKYDSADTPPNRFVRFALETFRGVCDDIINCEFTEPGPPRKNRNLRKEQGAAWQEAVQMRDILDSFLTAPFFAEVGRLTRIPFENQTLQKREGYREILHAFLMLDAAAQIDWPGRNDAYDGSNRDVATIYEFWLYFVLVRAFKEKLGMKCDSDPLDKEADGARPFCCTGDDGRMMIHLKSDEASFCRFSWITAKGSLRIHFFYNRPFNRSGVSVRGTYSKGFRPDYTLVIIPGDITEPKWELAEQEAEKSGRIAYLHLDAKYRVDKLTAILGEGEEESGEERRTAKTTGKFKNADLYKMHTYNEAIRRSVGSYVLYPGDDPMNEPKKNRFERYHEIVPGVGAFALKPKSGDGVEPEGLPFVLQFISDLLKHQLSKFTQSYRINYWTETTIREAPPGYQARLVDFVFDAKPPKDTQVLLGFVRDQAGEQECHDRKIFFCHAVEWNPRTPRDPDGSGTAGEPTQLGFDPFRSEIFVAYHQNRSAMWVAKVGEVRLVSAVERADEIGRALTEMKAAYYYRFQLGYIQPAQSRDVSEIIQRRPGRPIYCHLSDFAACPEASQTG